MHGANIKIYIYIYIYIITVTGLLGHKSMQQESRL